MMRTNESYTKSKRIVRDLSNDATYSYMDMTSRETLLSCYSQYVLKDFNTWNYSAKRIELEHLIVRGKLTLSIGNLCVFNDSLG